MQFWPTTQSVSKILHYTGRFKVCRMVQARLLRKNNPDACYANAVYKFLKQQAINNQNNVAFYSTNTKCKAVVCEPGFLVAATMRGKKVVVGVNETFKVADPDFSKLSFIPDAYLLYEIPDQETEISTLESNEDDNTIMAETFKNWYMGQVHYSIKIWLLKVALS